MTAGHVPMLLVIGVAVALTQIAVLATTIYLHRTLAHRSLAVHRKHHAFTDRPGDPHSPRLRGLWRVLLFNVYYYVVACRDRAMVEKYAPDLRPDRLDRLLFSHGTVGPVIGIVGLCLVMGLYAGLLAGLLHAALYVFVVAPLINAVGHWRGARNFENTARNSAVLALVTGGESLHNNHHANPGAPKFSVRAREFDPAWAVIRAFAAVRLLSIAGAPARSPRAEASLEAVS
jgi:stearoyl-CoA desaturase (delta-9 desaturase)